MFGECHAHVMLDGLDFRAARLRHEKGVCVSYIHGVFEAYRQAGVTFIRDGGDNLGVSRAAKDIANEYGIAYATPVFALYRQGNYGSLVGKPYADAHDFSARIGEAQRDGATFIKLMVTGILDFDRYGVVSEGGISAGLLKEIIGAAHARGLAVMAHVNGAAQIIRAAEAGADSIEHGFYQNEESIDAMRSCGCVWVPTLSAVANLLRAPRPQGKALKRIIAGHEENIRLALETGGMIALGSDAGAYNVMHGQGTCDEYLALSKAAEGNKVLDAKLEESESIIKDKFLFSRGL
jgi:imidazolonepropionase-like amidohydrolase